MNIVPTIPPMATIEPPWMDEVRDLLTLHLDVTHFTGQELQKLVPRLCFVMTDVENLYNGYGAYTYIYPHYVYSLASIMQFVQWYNDKFCKCIAK